MPKPSLRAVPAGRAWLKVALCAALVVLVLPAGLAAAAKAKTPTKGHSGSKTRHHLVVRPAPHKPISRIVTLHYFSKDTKTKAWDPKGRTLAKGSSPQKGDKLSVLSNEYSGNHKHHSRKPVGSGTLKCTYANGTTASCTYTLSVAGSQVAGKASLVEMQSGLASFGVNGGSGSYQGVKGLISSTAVGAKGADLVVVLLPHT
ncbi:MAG: hypothetical protein ACRDVP_10770 [Acidimicrobiales bacterium]